MSYEHIEIIFPFSLYNLDSVLQGRIWRLFCRVGSGVCGARQDLEVVLQGRTWGLWCRALGFAVVPIIIQYNCMSSSSSLKTTFAKADNSKVFVVFFMSLNFLKAILAKTKTIFGFVFHLCLILLNATHSCICAQSTRSPSNIKLYKYSVLNKSQKKKNISV